MLVDMYLKYANKNNWNITLIHENKNDHGGFRNISIEIQGAKVYGKFKMKTECIDSFVFLLLMLKS